MIYADDILLRFTIAEILSYCITMGIYGLPRYSCRLMTTNHAENATWIHYAFHMSVQMMVWQRMKFERVT